MAQLLPIFDLVLYGTGTVGQEVWVNLGSIPTGKQFLLGYATYIAQDKNCQFETRSNLTGMSTGTAGTTQLLDWTSAQGGTGVDRDFYQFGNINTLTVVSTGVEKLWLRVVTQSASTGVYSYIIRYLIQ